MNVCAALAGMHSRARAYALSTAQRPFAGGDMRALATCILRGSYPPLPGLYSDGLRSLLASMLARQPRARPTAARALEAPVMRARVQRLLAASTGGDAGGAAGRAAAAPPGGAPGPGVSLAAVLRQRAAPLMVHGVAGGGGGAGGVSDAVAAARATVAARARSLVRRSLRGAAGGGAAAAAGGVRPTTMALEPAAVPAARAPTHGARGAAAAPRRSVTHRAASGARGAPPPAPAAAKRGRGRRGKSKALAVAGRAAQQHTRAAPVCVPALAPRGDVSVRPDTVDMMAVLLAGEHPQLRSPTDVTPPGAPSANAARRARYNAERRRVALGLSGDVDGVCDAAPAAAGAVDMVEPAVAPVGVTIAAAVRAVAGGDGGGGPASESDGGDGPRSPNEEEIAAVLSGGGSERRPPPPRLRTGDRSPYFDVAIARASPEPVRVASPASSTPRAAGTRGAPALRRSFGGSAGGGSAARLSPGAEALRGRRESKAARAEAESAREAELAARRAAFVEEREAARAAAGVAEAAAAAARSQARAQARARTRVGGVPSRRSLGGDSTTASLPRGCVAAGAAADAIPARAVAHGGGPALAAAAAAPAVLVPSVRAFHDEERARMRAVITASRARLAAEGRRPGDEVLVLVPGDERKKPVPAAAVVDVSGSSGATACVLARVAGAPGEALDGPYDGAAGCERGGGACPETAPVGVGTTVDADGADVVDDRALRVALASADEDYDIITIVEDLQALDARPAGGSSSDDEALDDDDLVLAEPDAGAVGALDPFDDETAGLVAGLSAADSRWQRIETVRAFLESALGVERFMTLYRSGGGPAEAVEPRLARLVRALVAADEGT